MLDNGRYNRLRQITFPRALEARRPRNGGAIECLIILYRSRSCGFSVIYGRERWLSIMSSKTFPRYCFLWKANGQESVSYIFTTTRKLYRMTFILLYFIIPIICKLQFASVFGSRIKKKSLRYLHRFVLQFFLAPFFIPSFVSRKNNTLPIIRRCRLKSIHFDLRAWTPITIVSNFQSMPFMAPYEKNADTVSLEIISEMYEKRVRHSVK